MNDESPTPDATRSYHGGGSGHLEVRCPNCHSPTEVAVDTSLTDLTCSSCGSHFSLVDQSKATRMAPSLTQMGRFELIERLGVGGFGSVWKARDKELDRTVAIKIPRAGGMTAEEQEKFFREARAAAQLRHPSIVSVHEVGRDGDSVYIVSDFVRGVTLGDWLTGQKLTSREAAELAAEIADALHHAHEQGVVHRDLKPANIMIDGDGQPHLMDFGLARREVGEVTITMDGHVLGTPAYMSPEQAEGKAHTADRRSDVYSLGVILFQLLTAELPFRGNARMLIHQVIHDEPPSPRKLNSNVPKDLETITLKCLEKDRTRRYQTASEVRDELRCYLAGNPILARPIGSIARALRWAQRNRRIAILTASVAILLLTVAALSVVGYAIATKGKLAAERSAENEANLRAAAQKSEQRMHEELQRNRLLSTRLELKAADYRNVYRLLTEPLTPGLEQDWNWLAWQYCRETCVMRRIDARSIVKSREPIPPVRTAGWGIIERVNGSLVATVHAYQTVAFSVDVDQGTQIKYRENTTYRQFTAELGNGVVLRIIGGDSRSHAHKPTLGERIEIVNLTDNKTYWSMDSSAPKATAVAACTSRNAAAIGFEDGTIAIYRYKIGTDSADFAKVGTVRSTNEIIECLLFDDDGSRLHGLSGDWIVWTWGWSDSGAPDIDITPTKTDTVRRLYPSADGRLLASASYRGKLHLWDTATKTLLIEIDAHPSDAPRAGDVSLTDDGKNLLSTGAHDEYLRIWSAYDAKLADTLKVGDNLSQFQLANEGKELFITHVNQIHHWDLWHKTRLQAFPAELRDDEFIYAFRHLPKQRRLIVAYASSNQASNTPRSRRSEIWNTNPLSLVAVLPDEHTDGLRDVAISPDGEILALCSRDGTVTLWDWQHQRLIHRLPVKPGNGHANIVSSIGFHPQQPVLVSASHDNRVVFWSTQTGRELATINVDPTGQLGYAELGLLKEAVFSPDGSRLYVAVGGDIWWIDLTYYDPMIQHIRQERGAYRIESSKNIAGATSGG